VIVVGADCMGRMVPFCTVGFYVYVYSVSLCPASFCLIIFPSFALCLFACLCLCTSLSPFVFPSQFIYLPILILSVPSSFFLRFSLTICRSVPFKLIFSLFPYSSLSLLLPPPPPPLCASQFLSTNALLCLSRFLTNLLWLNVSLSPVIYLSISRPLHLILSLHVFRQAVLVILCRTPLHSLPNYLGFLSDFHSFSACLPTP